MRGTPSGLFSLLLALCVITLAACNRQGALPTPTATVNPAIYNQVPKTTFFEPGQCTAVLEKPVPAFTSSTLGGQPTGEIPAGNYQVVLAADYGSSVWYQLGGVGAANYISSTSAASTQGDCSITSK